MTSSPWPIFRAESEPHDDIALLPAPPAWRSFADATATRGATYQASGEEVEVVNAALFLRRPLLITGKPGVGKSSLAYAVARQLKLGHVLEWRITTRSTLTDGLYTYDAVGRLQEANLKRHHDGTVDPPDIGEFLRLGPLGTALYPHETPRVLLVDELDKSDLDLPNNLLHVFEEGAFDIPELVRMARKQRQVSVLDWDEQPRIIVGGKVRCTAFPFVIFTSNGEREFPPAFLRRCLRLTIQPPSRETLRRIVVAHFAQHQEETKTDILAIAEPIIQRFLHLRDNEQHELSTDQLLNAIYMMSQNVDPLTRPVVERALLRSLSS